MTKDEHGMWVLSLDGCGNIVAQRTQSVEVAAAVVSGLVERGYAPSERSLEPKTFLVLAEDITSTVARLAGA